MIYLDNAATSFPKPESVVDTVTDCLRNYCGNPGRGAHSLSMAAAEKVYECRELVASLFGCVDPQNISFTLNTTHALNIVIKGILRRGDHVLISDLEHNSVLRPIFKLASEGHICYDVFPTLTLEERRNPYLVCSKISALIRPNTRMLICCHASNICSSLLPLREIGALCRRRSLFFAVDAAQSAGHICIDMSKMGIDALCAPGHKSLLGPPGCGILALNSSKLINTLTEGGNGVNSLEGNMPDFSPERYETGTLAVPAIAGLFEGIKKINQTGILNIRAHSDSLWRALFDMLCTIKGVKIYAPDHSGSVLLFNIKDIPSDIIGRELDKKGICTRSGLHCSPLGHKTLKTPDNGAVRASFGLFNTKSDIEALWRGVKEISELS